MTPLRAWVATRVAVVVLVLAGGQQLLGGAQGFLDRWDSWDATAFLDLAEHGYPEGRDDHNLAAYFPGFPFAVRVAHLLVPDWRAAGLVVSLLAGAVAVTYLARLAELDGADGSRAVLYLLVSPYAVFLAAGYSEALFLAFALPAWFAARRGGWALASVLVAGACTVRVSGAFLAVALVVEWATTSRDWRVAPWLATPFLALAGYVLYLWHLSGDWLRWQHAQANGWGRHLSSPLEALRTTWDAGRNTTLGPEYQWSFRAEVVAVAVGVVVTVVLLSRREWGQATYVGLSVGTLATSAYYLSVARATLLWFPLWILLAQLAGRRPSLHPAYLATATPLMAVGVLTFTSGHWVG